MLAERSNAVAEQERRLTEIIRNNGERVSTIINNVLQLSRRDSTRPERLNSAAWLEEFRAEVPPDDASRRNAAVRVAPEWRQTSKCVSIRRHLHQVLWNLCENALEVRGANGSNDRRSCTPGV